MRTLSSDIPQPPYLPDAFGNGAPGPDLEAALNRMIAIKMEAYPAHWTDAERRELAEQHLFGLPPSNSFQNGGDDV